MEPINELSILQEAEDDRAIESCVSIGEHKITLDLQEDGIGVSLGYSENDNFSYSPGIIIDPIAINAELNTQIPGSSSVMEELENSLKDLGHSISVLFSFREGIDGAAAINGAGSGFGEDEVSKNIASQMIDTITKNLTRYIALAARLELRRRKCSEALVETASRIIKLSGSENSEEEPESVSIN